MVHRLPLSDYLRPGDACHFHRAAAGANPRPQPHVHDFCEVFWIDAGRGWHLRDGIREATAPGYLQLVAPDDAHAFSADPGRSAEMANLALPLAAWRAFAARACPEGDPLDLPGERRRTRVDAAGLEALRHAAAPLDAGRRDRRACERLLLTAVDLLLAAPARGDAGVPEWLLRALETVHRERRLAGVAGLVAASGHSREHLARACRAHLGRTPTVLLNGLRMARAAELVAGGDLPFREVASACGIANLGHFYRLFRAAHGATPALWRRRARALLGR